MPFTLIPQENPDRQRAAGLPSSARFHAALLGGSLAVVAALASAQSAPPSYNPNLTVGPNAMPDANAQMAMRDQGQKQNAADLAAANVERKKQMNDDSAKLLKLATELKSEVDKSSKDTLSLEVVRKAEEIEKLAHGVKVKMKLTAEAK